MRILILLSVALAFSLPAAANDKTYPPIEAAFSPDAGAERLVLKTIDSAQSSIRMAAYSFTSPEIMRKLLDARKRGVDIKIIVDNKGNRSKSSTAAMNLMVNAGIDLRTISTYKIHHDKYLIVDDKHIETGSFNYSKAAAKSNSENVIVIWNNKEVAASYLRHWQSRYDKGVEFISTY